MNIGKYNAMIEEVTEEPNNMSHDWFELMKDVSMLLKDRMELEHMKEVCQLAIYTFGGEAQTFKLCGEIGELMDALCKLKEGKLTKYDVASEIADVQILLEQMILLHGICGEVDRQRKCKIEYLDGKIKEAKNGKSVS